MGATRVMPKGRLGLPTPPVQGRTARKWCSWALNLVGCLRSQCLQPRGGRREREGGERGRRGSKGTRGRGSGGDSDWDVVLAGE